MFPVRMNSFFFSSFNTSKKKNDVIYPTFVFVRCIFSIIVILASFHHSSVWLSRSDRPKIRHAVNDTEKKTKRKTTEKEKTSLVLSLVSKREKYRFGRRDTTMVVKRRFDIVRQSMNSSTEGNGRIRCFCFLLHRSMSSACAVFF